MKRETAMRAARRQSGISLIELLISIAIGLFLLVGVISVVPVTALDAPVSGAAVSVTAAPGAISVEPVAWVVAAGFGAPGPTLQAPRNKTLTITMLAIRLLFILTPFTGNY